MKLTHATIDIDGRSAEYRDGADDDNEEFPTPVLILTVEDFDDAQDLLDTLSRSRARKRAAKDTTPPAATAAVPGNEGRTGTVVAGKEAPQHRDPPKCLAPDCIFDADGGEFCRDHASATAEQKAEWRKAREATPKAEAVKRSKAIRSVIESGGAPGPKAA